MQQLVANHDRELLRFYRLMDEVFSGYEALDETEHGYTFFYPADEMWLRNLEQLAEYFRARLPAIDVEVDADRTDGRPRLRVGGSDAAKGFVAGMILVAQSGGVTTSPLWRRRLTSWYRRATSSMRARPSFLIIGAPRCGTTSLYLSLTEHPRVLPATKKEVAFFDAFYNRGLAAYRAAFPLRSRRSERGAPRGAFITGEATPTYLAHPRVPRRVRETLPDVKLIAIIRDPVERAYSQYHFSLRHGFESLDFEAAIDAEPERLRGEREKLEADERYWSPARIYYSYLTTGLYVDHLEAWTKVFPREQMHVICMEAFAADPPGEFRRVLEFLELHDFQPDLFQTMDNFPYAPRHVKPVWPMAELSAATRERLAQYFRPHNERLWAYLGRDFGWNRSPTAAP